MKERVDLCRAWRTTSFQKGGPARPGGIWFLFFWAASATLGSLPMNAAHAAIVLQNTSHLHAVTPSGNTISWTHTGGSGSDRFLIVGVSFRRSGNNQIVSGVTYGGTPLTLKQRGQSPDLSKKYVSELWYLPSPALGTQVIQVTFSGAVDATVAGAASFTGVNPSNPLGTSVTSSGTNGTPSLSVSSAPGELVIDVLAIKGNNTNAITAAAGQTECWNDSTGNNLNTHAIGGGSARPGASSVSMSWTVVSQEQWAMVAVPMRPAASAGASISGTVFEDVTYGGGAGRDRAAAAGVGRPGARVELYSQTGVYVTSTATDAAGGYGFSGLAPGTYAVRVVNASVSSSRAGYVAGTHLAVQTFRTDASGGAALPVTDHVGGENPAVADGPNGKGGAILNLTTGVFTAGVTGTAQSVTQVSLLGPDVGGVDFGYSFDVIVNKNNTGQGSLRQFIVNANALANAGLAQTGRTAGIENAVFMLADGTARPGLHAGYPSMFASGVATVAPASALPAITSPVVLNAATQPGWSGFPIVELNGTSAGASASGFAISGGGSTVRGFVINRFKLHGIALSGSGSNTIVGNYLGTNAAGSASSANTNDGIYISGSPGNQIGETTPADRNVISGNTWVGIEVTGAGAVGNRIQGNYIGVDATGMFAVRNANDGIDVTSGATQTLIGGTLPSAGNVISGHSTATMDGIWLSGSSRTVVQGNHIGTNAAGTAALPNARAGIYILTSSDNTIGGSEPGAANVIAFNDSVGVRVLGTAKGNAILGNSIRGNRYLGVDLGMGGVTANDGAKNASAPNLGMDFPVLTGAVWSDSVLDVAGYVGSARGQTAFAGARIEIVKTDNDPSGFGEGERLLGTLTADAGGRFAGRLSAVPLAPGDFVSGLATDGSNNTSEFGPAFPVGVPPSSDLSLALAVDRKTPNEGDPVTLILHVTNYGPSAAVQVVARNRLPEGLRFASASASQGSYTSLTGEWTIGNLPPGAEASLSILTTVAFGTAGSSLIDTTVVTADSPDPVPDNNAAADSLVVQPWGARIRTGTYVGNGLSNRAITGVGFPPDLVIVKGLGPGAAVVATSTLPTGTAKELGPATAPASGLITALGVDGFTVGTDSRVNSAGLTYSWVCVQANPGAMKVGTYVGDAASFHDVTGLGFEPSYVMVLGEAATRAAQKFAPENSNNSVLFDPVSESASWIRGFQADGFSLGTSIETNGLGTTYHYAAWRALPNAMSAGSTYGTGVAGTVVAGAGFEPNFVIVKSKGALRAVHRTSALAADVTLPFSGGPGLASAIQRLLPDGYEAGTDSTVNTVGQTYYWAAFRDQFPPGSADLALAAGVAPGTARRGDTLTCTVTVENLGPDPASGVVVSDPIPTGVTFLDGTATQGAYDEGTGAWTLGNLTVGASATLTLTFQVSATFSGATITNTATAACGQADLDPSNNQAATEVVVDRVDLGLTLAVDHETPNEGDTLRFVITLSNLSPGPATGIDVMGRLPSGLVHLSHASSQGVYDAGTGTWDVGDVPEAGAATLELTTRVGAATGGMVLADTARITRADQVDLVPENDTTTVVVTVQSADLEVALETIPQAPDVGDTLHYLATITNLGPHPATGITVRNTLPAGLALLDDAASQGTFTAASGVWDVGMLPADGSATLGLTVRVEPGAAGAALSDTARVLFADQADPSATNNSAAVQTLVPSADLALVLGASNQTPDEGSTTNFSVDVSNGGPYSAHGIRVAHVLPAGLTYRLATTSQGSYDPGPGVWQMDSLAAGTSATLHVVADVDAGTAGATLWDSARITTAETHDPVPGNNRDSIDVRPVPAGSSGISDLALSETAAPSFPNEGDTLTCVVTLLNAGPDSASGIAVAAVLPAGLSYLDHASTSGSYAPGPGLWMVNKLLTGEFATLTLHAQVRPGTGGTTLAATARVTSLTQADPVPENDEAGASVTVASADLDLALTADPPTPNLGDTLRYTVTLSNHGPSPASGIAVLDVLAPGLAYVANVPSQGSYLLPSGRWTVGGLPQGDTATLELTAVVKPEAGGMVLADTARMTATDQADPFPGNDLAVVEVRVQSADLAVSLAADRSTANPGDVLTYTVTLSNNGPNDATGVIANSLFPSGLSYLTHVTSHGSYNPATGVWTVGSLQTSDIATLVLSARMEAGTAGTTVRTLAQISSADQADLFAANNADSVEVRVESANLAVAITPSDATPNEGDTLALVVAVQNLGPDAATGVVVLDRLPSGFTFRSAAPSAGVYDRATGKWLLNSLSAGGEAQLSLEAFVDAGTAGLTIVDTAGVAASDQADPNAANNRVAVTVTVQSADLALRVSVDKTTASPGDSLVFTVMLENHGPSPATGVVVNYPVPAGLSVRSGRLDAGGYAWDSGVWNVGTMPTGAPATLRLARIIHKVEDEKASAC